MIEYKNNTYFLSTKDTSYIMSVLPDGVLKHCYYGRRISIANMDYYNLYAAFDYTAPYRVNDDVTTMDALPQECPCNGRGDYSSPAVVIENSKGRKINDFKYRSHIIHKGAPILNGLPQLDVNTNTAEYLEIIMADIVSGVLVHLYYTVFDEANIIARHTVVENVTENAVNIQRIASASVDFESANMDMVSLHGRWGNERTMERYPLHYGKTIISSNRGASGHALCPFAALAAKNADEDRGDVYGISLIYSGNFEICSDVGQFGRIRLTAGINPETFSWHLKSGECFVSPQSVLTYSFNGFGGMSLNFHNMTRWHLGSCARNVKHPIVLNMWEAFYFDVTEQKVLNAINAAQEFDIDTVVLDDGWFGKRNNEFTSLGDWRINNEKFPGGLENIIKHCRKNGFKFGLWFEPEAVSRQSELFKEHPDWCIHCEQVTPVESRSELLLDFSRNEVVEAVYESIAKILRKCDVSYVKWDMNRNFSDWGSISLKPGRQDEHCHRYILGVYRLMEKLKNEFPHIFFEGSAGGGGRFDFGVLYYMPQIWTSDNTDPIGRLDIQYGTSMLFPPETISSHVSHCPNGQTGRTTPFKTRGEVAQLFSFGYELDINLLKDKERKMIENQIITHRKLEKWIYDADFYRIVNPANGESCAWQSVSKDKKHSVVLYVTRLTIPRKVGEYLKIKGLDTDKLYKVQPGNIMGKGDALMFAGIPIKEQYNDFESILFEIEESDEIGEEEL